MQSSYKKKEEKEEEKGVAVFVKFVIHVSQALAVECLKWREIAKNEKNIHILAFRTYTPTDFSHF